MSGIAPHERERRYWDRNARRYDALLRLIGRPMGRTLELVAEAIGPQHRVLEVAAGTGLVTQVIAARAHSVIATDYANEMVAVLRERVAREHLDNVRCEVADIAALPFTPASFDVVVAANVLHLVPDLEGALGALRRMLVPHGRLVAPTFCHSQTLLSGALSRLAALTGFPGHRRFTAESLLAALRNAGFEPVRTELVRGLVPIAYVEARPAPGP